MDTNIRSASHLRLYHDSNVPFLFSLGTVIYGRLGGFHSNQERKKFLLFTNRGITSPEE